MPKVTVSSLIDYEKHIAVDKLVNEGKYRSISEFIRIAVDKLLEDEI